MTNDHPQSHTPLFPLGQTVATPAALRLLSSFEVTPAQVLDRQYRCTVTWPRQLSPVEVGQPPVKGQVGFSRPEALKSVLDMQQVRISVDQHVCALDLGGEFGGGDVFLAGQLTRTAGRS